MLWGSSLGSCVDPSMRCRSSAILAVTRCKLISSRVAAWSPERRRSPRNRNALQRFGDRDFAEGVPPPSAFTLTSEPVAELCLAGSQPGMPCRIRSAFFDGGCGRSGLRSCGRMCPFAWRGSTRQRLPSIGTWRRCGAGNRMSAVSWTNRTAVRNLSGCLGSSSRRVYWTISPRGWRRPDHRVLWPC
jgi:hypothetical protein